MEADLPEFGAVRDHDDLPRRLELGAPLNKPVPETFYAEGETGYTDYPALSDAA